MLVTILPKPGLLVLRRGLARPAPWLPTPAQQKPQAPPATPPKAPSLGHPCVAPTLPHLWGSCHVSSPSFWLSPAPSSAWPPLHTLGHLSKSELRSGNGSTLGESQMSLVPESLIQQRGPGISAILISSSSAHQILTQPGLGARHRGRQEGGG